MTFKYDARSQSDRKVKYIENHVIYKSQLKRKSVFGFIPHAKINGNSVESDVEEKFPFFAMDDDVNSRQKSSYVTSDHNYHVDLEQAQNNPVFQVFNQVMVRRNLSIFLDFESTSPTYTSFTNFYFFSHQFLVEKFKKELIKQILKEHGSLLHLHSFWPGLTQ
jgi:hypothetical protein